MHRESQGIIKNTSVEPVKNKKNGKFIHLKKKT